MWHIEITVQGLLSTTRNTNQKKILTNLQNWKDVYEPSNVYVSQSIYKGFIFYTRSLQQHRAALGNDHKRMGDIYVRIVDHNMRLLNFPEATGFLIYHYLTAFNINGSFLNQS